MGNEELDFMDTGMLRRKAEEQLAEKQKNIDYTVIETDVKRLMHELQVHQIELEMQNEELRLAYETAETALKKYTILFDFAPMGCFTIDMEGTIFDLNFTGAEMLGEKRFSLINSNFKLFIFDDSKLAFNNFLDNVFAGNGKESCKVMLGYEGRPLCFVYMEGVMVDDDHKCLLSVIDIKDFQK
jgi:PAS domain-containing protein